MELLYICKYAEGVLFNEDGTPREVKCQYHIKELVVRDGYCGVDLIAHCPVDILNEGSGRICFKYKI